MNLPEKYRPQFHFTPEKNWMNDPNGLIYYKGKYHLFYQHNPNGDVWGDMSWGHAVSTDLFNWEHLPLALPFYKDAGIFSGSAVIDYTNSTGFGTIENPAMVAIFTKHLNDESNQSQCLAYSIDEGITWTYFEGNPVLDLQMTDFRDPHVWRDHENNRWLMVVVKARDFKAAFFESQDLKSWNHLSDFGPAAATGGCWECPDLFQLTTIDGKSKWILIISINPGAPLGGSATQYFIGEWDGKTFTPDDTKTRWLDLGFDNYAGITYSDAPDNRRIFIGWMSNWEYARDVPTSPWRSAMTLPRELTLEEENGNYYLVQHPVREFAAIKAQRFEIEFSNIEDSFIEINNEDKKVLLSYSPKEKRLTIDRSAAWIENQNSTQHSLQLKSPRALLILDRSGFELFGDGGRTVVTDLTLLDGGTPVPSAKATLKIL